MPRRSACIPTLKILQFKARFRRIRYANRMTETRTDFGNELDAFDAARVQVRGWGIDAVVSANVK